jgi:hypothetical protein
MDDGTVAGSAAEASVDLLREHSDEMAFWLTLGVLQLDPVAIDDPELVDRLVSCQQRLEERLRAKTAIAVGQAEGDGVRSGQTR